METLEKQFNALSIKLKKAAIVFRDQYVNNTFCMTYQGCFSMLLLPFISNTELNNLQTTCIEKPLKIYQGKIVSN